MRTIVVLALASALTALSAGCDSSGPSTPAAPESESARELKRQLKDVRDTASWIQEELGPPTGTARVDEERAARAEAERALQDAGGGN